VVTLLVAGCSNAEGDSEATSTAVTTRTQPTRKQDVAWLILLRKWESRIGRRSSRAEEVAGDVRSGTREQAALDRAARPLEHCAETLDDDVGEPRVPRYRQGYGLFKTACAAASAWAKTLRESGEDRSLAKQAAVQEQKVGDSFGDAETHLVSSFLAVKDLPIQGGDRSRSRIEPRFGRALNRLLYKSANAAQVEVRCWSKEDWPKVKYEYGGYAGNVDFAGFAYDGFRISIASEYCASLVQLVYEHARPTKGKALLYAAASVELLAHEGGHLYFSETNEAKTECYAVQRARELGRILGLGGTYSDDLAAVYWKYVYPHNTREYRTPACRNGGPLDLNPKSDLWP
jgi:hypothetical protein